LNRQIENSGFYNPLLNKRRENAELGLRNLWGFLVDIIDPSLVAALRNTGRVTSDVDNMCDAVTELIVNLSRPDDEFRDCIAHMHAAQRSILFLFQYSRYG